MWVLWWALYIIGGLVGFYVFVVLPLVYLYSTMFPQKCLTCNQQHIEAPEVRRK